MVIRYLEWDDNGVLQQYGSYYWKILTRKGYRRATEDLRVAHPARTPACERLTAAKNEECRKILSYRIIVEN